MYRWLLLLLVVSITTLVAGDESDWLTYYEKSGYLETPRYPETIEYCKRLDAASDWLKYTSFGMSPQGRELPLVIVDKNGHFTPSAVGKSGNAVLLIQSGIHAGEIDGKDASLMLMREMVISKKLSHLLNGVTILFIPIFNVDGHERFGPHNRINQNGPKEMGWRTTAQNYNLNRDFLKADAQEMQAWLRLFNR
ncbi:MAG: M14 family zinc carboxypeptidase, partial [Calditrichia bacterium]